MKKFAVVIATIVVLIGFTSAGWCSVLRGNKRTAFHKEMPAISSPSGPQKPARVKINVLAKMDEARRALQDKVVGYRMCDHEVRQTVGKGKRRRTKIVIVQRLCAASTLLAVAHEARGHLEFVTVNAEGGSTPDGFSVTVNHRNGVNTDFEVELPSGYLVLALRRAVRIRDSVWREVVYTPCTDKINLPEVRERGSDYLRAVIITAKNEIRTRQLVSRAFPNTLLAERLPLDVAVSLVIDEHMDVTKFENGEAPELVNRILTTIGANRTSAYNYAISRSGARGLFQFMPQTYRAIRLRYPEARLNPDFVDGMNDHVNAAIASFLLFDSDLAYLPPEMRERLAKDGRELGRYLAAAYNGGAPRAKRALVAGGRHWPDRLTSDETRTYVQKLDAIHPILFASR